MSAPLLLCPLGEPFGVSAPCRCPEPRLPETRPLALAVLPWLSLCWFHVLPRDL